MKDLNLFTGGHPFKIDDILHLQTGIKEALDHITLHFQDGVTTPYRLYGAEITEPLPNSFTVTAGAIYYNGEIYTVAADSGLTNVGNDILDFDWIIQTTYAAPSPVTYQDATSKNVHTIKTAVLVDNNGTPGSTGFFGPASTLPTITSALSTDNIGAPAVAWDDSTALSGINAGSTLTGYIQYILNAIGVLNGVVQSQYGAPHEFKAQITPINGNLMPEIMLANDSGFIGGGGAPNDTNFSGSPYFTENVSQGLGVKTLNTIHFNDSLATGMYDNGNNWFGNKYIVPTAGSYNFFIENLLVQNGASSRTDLSESFFMQTNEVNYNSGLSGNSNLDSALSITETYVTFPTPPTLTIQDGQAFGGGYSVGLPLAHGNCGPTFRINLAVRRPGFVNPGVTITPNPLPKSGEMVAYLADVMDHNFNMIENPLTAGDWKVVGFAGSFTTQNISSAIAEGSSVTYDNILGLTLEPGDEIYFNVTSGVNTFGGGGAQPVCSLVPVSGYAYCEKTS